MDPLKYFALFRYVPTVEECARFRGFNAKGKNPQDRVLTSVNRKYLAQTLKRQKISLTKLKKRHKLLLFLGSLPGVEYLGLSGSVSMLNAEKRDDLDLFVITKPGSLWTTRFILVIVTSLLGVRRKRGERWVMDKLCLNLFFSAADLNIPKQKQTLYVAHEVLQLKTIVNKHQTYERLLAANPWLNKFARLGSHPARVRPRRGETLPGLVERALRHLQLWLINRHKTTEIITNTQLWFFPDDFEKKVKMHYS